MHELLTAAIAMPAAIFTALVLVMVGYWLLVALGTMDLDLFHIHLDHAGHVDGDIGSHGFLEFLSIGKVPITLLASLFVICGWLLCLAGELLVRPLLPAELAGWPVSLGFGVGASVLGLIGTALAARPLRPLFTLNAATRRDDLIGRQALVTSLTVDDRFGTATCFIDGDDILLNVVIRDGRRLVKGDDAVVVDFDEDAGVHLVAPLRPPLASEPAGEVPPAPPAPPNQPIRDPSHKE